jgi:predicted acetyltransferase
LRTLFPTATDRTLFSRWILRFIKLLAARHMQRPLGRRQVGADQILVDPDELLAIGIGAVEDHGRDGLVDREARGGPIVTADGSTVPRLPGYHRWMWDGEFCGLISFRWQPGTAELPPYCLGHVGYSVVPWKRNLGYATLALKLLLPETRSEGLPYIELVADADNVASQRVIEANGGQLVERFLKSKEYGGKESLRFRIFSG